MTRLYYYFCSNCYYIALLLFCCISIVTAKAHDADNHGRIKPVVLMHGMGDYGDSKGMRWVKTEIETAYPGIFIHSIVISKTERADRAASFYDDLNRQIEEIHEQLKDIVELKDGFDAIGFSQGGQILRGYVERFNDPPVRNLISIGSQHQGVSNVPGCPNVSTAKESMQHDTSDDLVMVQADFTRQVSDCSWWKKMIKQGVYYDFVQNRVVQAQYFKDPTRFEEYLKKSIFLADINNEREVKNPLYKMNLSNVKNFVMLMFANDTHAVPKESAIFGYFDGNRTLSLREQEIYKEDWIGLRTLDERGALYMLTVPGQHLKLGENFIKDHLSPWLGSYDVEDVAMEAIQR